MSNDSIPYFRERAMAERALAMNASRPDVAAIHDKMAKQYQALVDTKVRRPALRIAEDRSRASI